MKRLFTGIAVPAEQMTLLVEHANALCATHPELRWSASSGWHVTLQFYGMVDEAREQRLRAQLCTVQARPVEVAVQGTGVFERAGVLWTGVMLSASLSELQRNVVDVGTVCGFVVEDRPYRPHITLARRKGRSGPWNFKGRAAMDADQQFGSFVASEFVLYESVAGPGGARYEVLQCYPLRS